MNIEDDFESGTWNYLAEVDEIQETDELASRQMSAELVSKKAKSLYPSEPTRKPGSMTFGSVNAFSTDAYEENEMLDEDLLMPQSNSIYVIEDEDVGIVDNRKLNSRTTGGDSVFVGFSGPRTPIPVPSLSRSLEILQEKVHALKQSRAQVNLEKANNQKLQVELLEELRVVTEQLDAARTHLVTLQLES